MSQFEPAVTEEEHRVGAPSDRFDIAAALERPPVDASEPVPEPEPEPDPEPEAELEAAEAAEPEVEPEPRAPPPRISFAPRRRKSSLRPEIVAAIAVVLLLAGGVFAWPHVCNAMGWFQEPVAMPDVDLAEELEKLKERAGDGAEDEAALGADALAGPPTRAVRRLLRDAAEWATASDEERLAAAKWVGRRLPGIRYDEMVAIPAGPSTRPVALFTHEETELALVLVPGGRLPGSEGDGARVEPFLLARNEITWGAFADVDQQATLDPAKKALPVTGMDWDIAVAWCKGAGLQLPTEAEWEYACRAGTRTRFFTGDDASAADAAGWHAGNSGGRLHAAGERSAANPFGLLDLNGNVWEWCHDTWADDGDTVSDHRAARGGCWSSPAGDTTADARHGFPKTARLDTVGFRPARVIPLD